MRKDDHIPICVHWKIQGFKCADQTEKKGFQTPIWQVYLCCMGRFIERKDRIRRVRKFLS